MKHLVKLSELESKQYDEVVALLLKHRVNFRETPGSFIGAGTIQVDESDFATAKRILREESREFAKEARDRWEQEWRTEHGGSVARWFLHRLKQRPGGTVGELILLIIAIAIFLVYPIWYVVRAAI